MLIHKKLKQFKEFKVSELFSDLACETNETCFREAGSQLPSVNRAKSS